jgi:cytoskeletal protein RodZ
VIALIEAGDFSGLPSRTYATGFTRSYARALGLDADSYVAALRQELLGVQSPSGQNSLTDFEPGDPARVPSARFAWVAALLALVLIAAGLVFWRNYYVPAMTLPSILPTETPSAAPVPVAPAAPAVPLPPEATFTPPSTPASVGAVPSTAALDPFGLPRGTGLNAGSGSDQRALRSAGAQRPVAPGPSATSTPTPAASPVDAVPASIPSTVTN